MRFMVLVKANKDSAAIEAGEIPAREQLDEMGRFNAELIEAGVLLEVDGLHASSKGARIAISGEKRAVTDGPFAESKELIAGFWMVQAKSKEEVIERFLRCPFQDGEIEIRQVFEAEDFGPELAAKFRAQEEQLRRG